MEFARDSGAIDQCLATPLAVAQPIREIYVASITVHVLTGGGNRKQRGGGEEERRRTGPVLLRSSAPPLLCAAPSA